MTKITCKAMINKPKAAIWNNKLTRLSITLRPHVRGDCDWEPEDMSKTDKLFDKGEIIIYQISEKEIELKVRY